MGFVRHAATLAWKDLRVEYRSREILITMIFFAVMVVLMFSFAFTTGDDAARAAALAPGFLFIAVLFAGTLGLSRAFDRERDADTMRGLLLAPVPRASIFAGKAIAIVVFMLVVHLAVLFLTYYGVC